MIYLRRVINDTKIDVALRVKAAIAAAPFVHGKAGDVGKKEARATAAKAVTGRFTAAAPPLKRVK